MDTWWSSGPYTSFGRFTVAAGAVWVALLVVSAMAPSVAQATTALMQMQPDHSTGRTAPSGRSTGSSASTSSPCWASSNWSGYALSETTPAGLSCVPASGTAYTSVSATWTVPTVTGSSSSGHGGGGGGFGGRDAISGRGGGGGGSSSTYSAVWTGIDGFSNDDLIQAGTEQDYADGAASYSAWWEILPAAETDIPSITVDPGDSITVTITKETSSITSPASCSAGKWLITLSDNGSSSHAAQPEFATCQSYSGPGTSAEWIVEAPEVNGRIATLADYGSTTFGLSPSVLTVNGADTDLAAGNGGEMEQNGEVVSVPSSPTDGDAFSCAYGSTAPSPPS